FPTPLVEFRLLIVAGRERVDFVFAADEAKGEPFLPLAAEDRETMRRAVIGRKVVGHPAGLGEIFGTPHTGLFPEFAEHRFPRILVLVDATLRHLPFEARQDDFRPVVLETARDEDAALLVEQRDTDIRTIGLLAHTFSHARLSRERRSASITR